MIQLAFPKSSEVKYLVFQDFVLGPFDQNMKSEGESVTFSPRQQYMLQGSGIFREKSVQHLKLSGRLQYVPLATHGSLTIAPTLQYPNRMVGEFLNYYGTKKTIEIKLGTISEGSTAMAYASSAQTVARHYEFFKGPNGNWAWYYTAVDLSDPYHVFDYYLYEITSFKVIGAGRYYVYTNVTHFINTESSGWDTPNNWGEPQQWGTIQSIGGSIFSSKPATGYGDLYSDVAPNTFSPASAVDFISMLIDQYGLDRFPIPDYHYGDLAMEASEKVSANDVNMIAFFRDLRDPKQMIPRLKNLRTLFRDRKALDRIKDLSDDFLSVKYGVLPTISDLQSIWDAFHKVKPYIDKNGFNTYSAGHISHLYRSNNYYELEQHIKLAIDNEDNALQALDQALENIGLLPSLENLWDLVPYSFVVDWFTNVGDFLERADTRLRLQRLNIRYVTSSRKATVRKFFSPTYSSPYSGTLEVVRYHRWVSDQCPAPPLFPKATSNNPFGHWLEGAALLIQRKRR